MSGLSTGPTAAFVAVLGTLTGAARLQADPDFDRAVAPVLLRSCVECHAGAEPAGKLDLTTHKGLLTGGKSGPAIVPGKPAESILLDRIVAAEMPPPKQGKPQPLPEKELEALRTWVAAGAEWPAERTLDLFEATTATRAGRDWWSLQPVQRPAVPGPGNPIDAFIRSKLAARGWEPAPPADPRTLIRRVYYDLIGLPPTFEQVLAFAKDPSAGAYEKLIDTLLASPHYGERWGRYWLDVVRYAETCGYERDQTMPNVWKYREYVIRAFNEDRPLDRFVLEQLAGDELPDRSEASVIATGFLRLGTWNDEPNDPNEYKYERLEDLVGATSTAFLGITVKCARCHDHKFDPVRQTDYYRMAAAFWAGFIEPGPRELLGGPPAKVLGVENVHGWTDRGRTVPPFKLLKKGDPNRPGAVVAPGHLSMLPGLDKPVPPPPEGAKTTHRRLALAQWIADPRNPLTPRVWVNRLWQHHFGHALVRTPDNFGFTGEKPTHPELLDWLAAEFVTPAKPTDGNRWASKRLHKLILLSNTYRQSSLHPRQDEYVRFDAANHLWWRAERRRLDAEAIRDSLLFASGNLKLDRIGGPSFSPAIAPDALEGLSMKGRAWTPSPPAEQGRRSVYVFAKRGLLPPLLTAFDFADTTLPVCRRDVTTVAPQALALLNNPFVHEQSEALAKRVGAAKTEAERVRRAWQLALGRDPSRSELDSSRAHLSEQQRHFAGQPDAAFLALASLCHVLLNTNEFLYVD